MTSPRVRQFADVEKLSQAAAREALRLAEQCLSDRGRFTLALAGGSTPRRMYQIIAQSNERKRIDWNRVFFFWGDERCVPPDHPESNYRMAYESLLEPLGVPASNIIRMEGEATDLESAAEAYSREIARIFNAPWDGPAPEIDLVLLGLGADGHTASLFPNCDALTSDRWTTATYVGKLNAMRLTMTADLLSAAGHVIFLVAGEDKAEAVADVLEQKAKASERPALLIRPRRPANWFLDFAAASRLSRRLDVETAETPIA